MRARARGTKGARHGEPGAATTSIINEINVRLPETQAVVGQNGLKSLETEPKAAHQRYEGRETTLLAR